MPSSHVLDAQSRFGAISFWGDVDGQQLLAETRGFLDKVAWRSGINVLWDARDVRRLALTPEDVARLKALIEERRTDLGPGRAAIVGRSEDVLAIGHLIKTLTARDPKRRVEVFHTLQPALQWLGRCPDQTLPARPAP